MSSNVGPDIVQDSLIIHLDSTNDSSLGIINRNLFASPEEITSSHPWYTSGATVQLNVALAPNGTMTADKVVGNYGVSSRKSAYQYVAGLKAGETYTFSVYLKAAGFTTAMIWHDNNPYSQPSAYNGAQALLNLSTGVSSNVTYATMTPVGNDWYRCQTTAVYPYSGDYTYSISLGDANGSGTPVGNGVDGLLVWGVQLEKVSSAVPLPAFEANFNTSTSNSLITYTRSTVGTYYNSSGLVTTAAINTPRYDCDPVTFTNRGLLIEAASTNWIPNSTQSVSQFSVGTGGVTTNLATSNNPSSASAVSNSVRALAASSTISEIKYMLRSETWTTGQVNIFSAFFKQITANIMYPCLVIDDAGVNGGIYARFDLSGNGTVLQGATTGGTGIYLGSGIEKLPNGWYRCWVVGTPAISTGGRASITIRNNTTTANGYDPASTATAIGDGVYVWGPMIEKNVGDRRKPSSYYETTGVTATRGADSAVVTGGNFSSWFNNTEGTILIEYYRSNETTFGGYTWPMSISDGTNNNQISFFNILNTTAVTNSAYRTGNSDQLDYLQVNLNNGINKLAQSYKTNQVAFAANGSLIGVDYTNTTPAVNKLTIGNSYAGGNDLNDRVSRIVYWPVALSPSQVTAVTNMWSSLTTTAGVAPTTYYPTSSNILSNRLLDISGNSAHGTITGTYGYDNTSYSVPVLTLNSNTASNGQISLTTQDLDRLAQTYNFTVFFAARKRYFGLLGNNNGNSQFFQGVVNGYSAGWRISENNQGTPGTPFSGRHNWSLGFNDISTSVAVSDTAGVGNRMCICAFTVTPTTLTAFVNGNFNTVSNPRNYVSGPSSPLISFTGAGAGSFNGDIGFFMIYNRALTQAEITQSFNSLRSRYGI